MILTDEKLSAFLDGELNFAEMDTVREAIAQDVTISDRLAALAEVDRVVKVAAEKATAVALPNEIVALLNNENQGSGENGADQKETLMSDASAVSKHSASQSSMKNATDNVAPFVQKAKSSYDAKRKQAKWKGVSPLAAIAASVAVLSGLVFFNQQSAETTQPSHWANVSFVLDSHLSGEAKTFEGGVTVTPQLSFFNTDFNYCRQAEVASRNERSVLIACKDKQGAWQLAASKLDVLGSSEGQYHTATSTKSLEDELDNMMASAPLNRKQEKNAIEATWLADKAEGVDDEN